MKAKLLLCATLLACASASLPAAPPLLAHKEKSPASFSWLETIQKEVPALQHDRGTRWPMILWQAGPFELQSPETYKALLARGLTQHILLDEKMIPVAKALQDAGSPVIMMQGEAGTWPSSLAGDPKEWAHDFDPGYVPKDPVHACPLLTKGWAINADNIRATLQKFKDAGVTVDAVWMDWEGDPAGGGPQRYEQALHCRRCRAMLPPGVLASQQSFDDYSWRRYMELTGAYLAAPVAEIFPHCSTTNWHAVVSTQDLPVLTWLDRVICPGVPPFFTASNPVAYGNTVSLALWDPAFKLDREHVDQFYTRFLLREVSTDAANRLAWTSGRGSVPWVCRWCPDNADPTLPIMSRERYREILRHLWLRGIDGMQIFNPLRAGFEEMAVDEVKDAVTIYDEMLAYRDFLDRGTPLSLDVPKIQDDGVIWSGLRLEDRAVVRTFKQGVGTAKVTIEPWPGKKITLEATPSGKTFLLLLKDGKIRISE